MPIYIYECPACGARIEAIKDVNEVIYGPEQAPTCGPHEDDGSIIPMRRVPAVANFKFGGAEGKRRTALQVRERNEAYHNSPKGQEEHRANVAAAHKRLGIS